MIKAAILEHVPRHVAPTTADLWWDRGTTDPRNLPSAMVYPVIVKDNYGKSSFFFIGKPSINGPFSMAVSNNQRVNHV